MAQIIIVVVYSLKVFIGIMVINKTWSIILISDPVFINAKCGYIGSYWKLRT